MDINKVDLFMLSKNSMFPKSKLPLIREMLEKADEESWININSIAFKNPTTALLMSVAAGTYGVDRFYLKQPLLGIGKLCLTLMLVAWVIMVELTETDDWMFISFGVCVSLLVVFWYFIDIFLISKTTKEQNFNILLTILN